MIKLKTAKFLTKQYNISKLNITKQNIHSTNCLKMTEPEMKNTPRTAAIIVIGDEILKGQVHDTNSYYVSKALYKMGIKLQRVCVVGDCEEDIIREINFSSPKFTYVITTGGIGPTHDDITFSAVAKAFHEPLVANPVLVKISSEFFKTSDLNSPAMKLAHVPQSAKLTFGFDKVRNRPTLYPNVSIKNVFIFPGIPQLMERSFAAVSEELFSGGSTKFYMKEMYLSDVETNIADHLNMVVKEFPGVIFGSYPKYDSYYKVRLTIESQNEREMMEAHGKLISMMPSDIIVDYDASPLENVYEKLRLLVERSRVENYDKALQLVEDTCQKYRPDQICVFLGNDLKSTAVLHLCFACFKRNEYQGKLRALYVSDSYQDDNYIKDTINRYNIEVEIFQDISPTSAINTYISNHTDTKIIVMGSSKAVRNWQDSVEPSSVSVDVMLIQPLAKWSDNDVWTFVRSLCLPYSSLNDPATS